MSDLSDLVSHLRLAARARGLQDRDDAAQPLPQQARFRSALTLQQQRQMQKRMFVMLIEIDRLPIARFRFGCTAARIAHEPEQEERVSRWAVRAHAGVTAIGGFVEVSLIRQHLRFIELDGPLALSATDGDSTRRRRGP